MRVLLLIFSFITLGTSAHACFIETHEKVLILGSDANNSKLIKKTDCSDEVIARFAAFASDAQGTVSSSTFKKVFPEVELSPYQVSFMNFADQLNVRSLMPIDGRVMQAKQINGKGFIALSKDQRLDIDCTTCPSTGENTFKVTVRDPLGTIASTHWLKATIGVPTKALVATKSHAATLFAIDATGFTQKVIISDRPDKLIPVDFPLHFHKLSKSLSAGDVLERGNTSPVQLVRPGISAQVTVKDGGITISGNATPLSYGVWGETIKLKNNRSSRIIMGKVVDLNKVVVEL